jgi:hypothetical protein
MLTARPYSSLSTCAVFAGLLDDTTARKCSSASTPTRLRLAASHQKRCFSSGRKPQMWNSTPRALTASEPRPPLGLIPMSRAIPESRTWMSVAGVCASWTIICLSSKSLTAMAAISRCCCVLDKSPSAPPSNLISDSSHRELAECKASSYPMLYDPAVAAPQLNTQATHTRLRHFSCT